MAAGVTTGKSCKVGCNFGFEPIAPDVKKFEVFDCIGYSVGFAAMAFRFTAAQAEHDSYETPYPFLHCKAKTCGYYDSWPDPVNMYVYDSYPNELWEKRHSHYDYAHNDIKTFEVRRVRCARGYADARSQYLDEEHDGAGGDGREYSGAVYNISGQGVWYGRKHWVSNWNGLTGSSFYDGVVVNPGYTVVAPLKEYNALNRMPFAFGDKA